MNSGLNIAALSRRTGVAADTLRKWEQRYGILAPTRTSGGQRRYSEVDVARVEWLVARLSDGYRIGEAAALLGTTSGDTSRTPAEHRDALIDAARSADLEAVTRLLDQAFALHSLQETLSSVVQPLLKRVGDEWEAGTFTVAQEHLVSEAIRARIERLLADARGGVRGVAVLACAPGERHDLGLLMLAVMLRADGWQVAYLGADTPLPDAFALAERLDARVLCLSVTMPETMTALQGELGGSDGVAVVVGGAAASARTVQALGVRHLNSNLGNAVRELRALST
jgi:MerR family transcriptional regulator, light-induced transcriptional regulator